VGGPVKSTLLVDQGIVYGTSWGQEAFAMDVNTGKLIWKHPLKAKSQVSPVLFAKQTLLIVSDHKGDISALSLDKGTLMWSLKNSVVSQLSSPIVVKTKDQEWLVFACRTQQICLIDSSGKIVAAAATPGLFSGSPWVFDDHLYLSLNSGPVVSMKMVR
jgi:outer membrane protein assembly factor BamB